MEESRQPEITIDYSYNRLTGNIHMSVAYHSLPGRDATAHEQRHKQIVEDLLIDSGLAGAGNCLVRVTRDQVVTNFIVETDPETLMLTWTETSQERLSVTSSRPAEDQAKKKEKIKHKENHVETS